MNFNWFTITATAIGTNKLQTAELNINELLNINNSNIKINIISTIKIYKFGLIFFIILIFILLN